MERVRKGLNEKSDKPEQFERLKMLKNIKKKEL